MTREIIELDWRKHSRKAGVRSFCNKRMDAPKPKRLFFWGRTENPYSSPVVSLTCTFCFVSSKNYTKKIGNDEDNGHLSSWAIDITIETVNSDVKRNRKYLYNGDDLLNNNSANFN